jgi:hypothetical protein
LHDGIVEAATTLIDNSLPFGAGRVGAVTDRSRSGIFRRTGRALTAGEFDRATVLPMRPD